MFNSNCASVPLVANIDGNGNNGGWADGGWLWIIVVFALLFGWGNGGFGSFGGNNGGGYVATAATQADIQRGFDNSAVISKLDGISNGLCDGFYAMNNSMLTGFNGINTNIMQTGYGIQQAINADTVANMQNTNALQSQLANCCCETREAIQGVNYNMATNTCALQNTMNNNTRDIIDSQNAGTRAILDFLTNDKIATLQAENNDLRRAKSCEKRLAVAVLNILRLAGNDLKLSVRDFDIQINHSPQDNMYTKAQTLTVLLQSGIHPLIAIKTVGLWGDAEKTFLLSKPYLDNIYKTIENAQEQEKKAQEIVNQLNNQQNKAVIE